MPLLDGANDQQKPFPHLHPKLRVVCPQGRLLRLFLLRAALDFADMGHRAHFDFLAVFSSASTTRTSTTFTCGMWWM
jgi:hypothetical protein